MSRLWSVLFTFVLAAGFLGPAANANAGNKEVLFTVNHAVEIPGRVLAPGRYEMRLQQTGSPIAGVWSANGTHFYGYFDTDPVYRFHTAARTKIVLSKVGPHNPERLNEWFYPGEHTGNQFVYPSSRNIEMAKGEVSNNQGAAQTAKG